VRLGSAEKYEQRFSLRRRDHLEYFDVNGEIILK
jgi:hypothetical protein